MNGVKMASINTKGGAIYFARSLSLLKNLYLVVLKFRFPPLNFIQLAANTLTYISPHADSMLLFADIINSFSDDWRFNFLEKQLSRKFDRERPNSLEMSERYSVPLASVLLPVIHAQASYLEVLVPTRNPWILSLSREGDNQAVLKSMERREILSHQEKLRLCKRDDIAKLAVVGTGFLKLAGKREKGLSAVNSRRGGYRAIDVTLKVPMEYLSTQLAFFASLRDYDGLNKELEILRRFGIGKKRDMGFGDLINWQILKVKTDNILIADPMVILHAEDNKSRWRLITLRNIPALLIDSLKYELDKYRGHLLTLGMNMVLSREKPPYWLREGLYIAPFSEFLLKV